ncbi:hotdog fold thioesterase [Ferruginibacter yonginensis]|uniref:Hotdog fold thioesterase n=1 Tax=Ferruginibacter yonginensis TaxID=1310416 RepID=A0ABV8QNJ7_9BACT
MASNSIWFNKDLQLADLHITGNTLGTHLDMQWEEVGPDYLKMSMPVDERTKQPYGLLHGGASCALAETVGSVASYLVLDPSKYICVGLEINANHLRSVREGRVVATATKVHLGATTHVWDIKIHDAQGKLACISRLTVAILANKRGI